MPGDNIPLDILAQFPQVPSEVPLLTSTTRKRAASGAELNPRFARPPEQYVDQSNAVSENCPPFSFEEQSCYPVLDSSAPKLLPVQWQAVHLLKDLPKNVVLSAIETVRHELNASWRATNSTVPMELLQAENPQQPNLPDSPPARYSLFPRPAKLARSGVPATGTGTVGCFGHLSEAADQSDRTYLDCSSTGSSSRTQSMVALSFASEPSSRSSISLAATIDSLQSVPPSSHLQATKRTDYTCSDCYKVFMSKSSLCRHANEVHKHEGEYSCLPGGFITKTEWGSECAICNMQNPTLDHLYVHNFKDCYHRSHLGIPRRFKRRIEFCKHLESHGVFKDSLAFKRWTRYARNKSAWGCGFCLKVLFTWHEFQEHLVKHSQSSFGNLKWDHSTVMRGLLSQPFLLDAWQRQVNIESCLGNPVLLLWNENNTEALQSKLEERREDHQAASCAEAFAREACELMLPMYKLKITDSSLLSSGVADAQQMPWLVHDLAQSTTEAALAIEPSYDPVEGYSSPRPAVATSNTSAPDYDFLGNWPEDVGTMFSTIDADKIDSTSGFAGI